MNQTPTEIYCLRIPTPFSVGPVNVYIIKGNTVTMVDTGPKTKEARELLAVFIKQNGLNWSDIDHIFLTHPHVDHCGLTAEILEHTDARVIAHPHAVPMINLDDEYLAYHDSFFRNFYHENGVPNELLGFLEKFRTQMNAFTDPAPVHTTLEGGITLPGESEWLTVFTPGHTQDHLALYREKDGAMIVGDFLIKEVPANAFIEPPFERQAERARPILVYREAMGKISQMPITRMFSGHGDEITDYRALIASRLSRNLYRADKLAALLEKGPKTAYELSAEFFPLIYKKELPLTMSDTVGHLDLLEAQGRVRIEQRDGVYTYSLV
ncbi:MBL fold metallo-hydrolase [Aneurinibacillus sp. Ricciae_BoGa-3]|uniref:MBL fold metallo-hydrolase n=1 Tax=Aneurinibacillus sp. Ricciae_BoGa-3 TaxID=3022697 RepID=UPI0023404EA4|nr:MBL fold metallo-hydrolase [Aneurinibacillus sp. Ricciae_BoGa-3]WCK55778.1 MBL fold metallo-hydrolase [Aneurinibacillus sp. Ricciae_BoGa-3]